MGPFKFYLVFICLAAWVGQNVFANNPPWARDYIGQVKFKLTDDNRLNNLKNEWKNIEAKFIELDTNFQKEDKKLKRLNNTSQELQEAIRTNQQLLRKNKQEIDRLASAMVDGQAKLDQVVVNLAKKNEALAKKSAELAAAEAKITAQAAVEKAITDQMKPIKDRLDTKKREKNQLVKTCIQSGKSKEECQKLPEVLAINKEMNTIRQELKPLQQKLDAEKLITQKLVAAKQAVSKEVVRVQGDVTRLSQKAKTQGDRLAQQKIKRDKLKAGQADIRKLVDSDKQKKTGIDAQVPAQRQMVTQLKQALTVLSNKNATAEQSFRAYRQRLIAQILEANNLGAAESAADADVEGTEIAKITGGRFGLNDGRFQGLKAGERDGRKRDYERGLAQGRLEGKKDGERDGRVKGKETGLARAYKKVGKQEGDKAGINRANKSDASSVGKAQGDRDGTAKAKTDGQSIGFEQAEGQVIREYEQKSLKDMTLQGPYAVQYNRNLPPFPGVNRKYFNPTPNFRKNLLKSAYLEGYRVVYNGEVRRSYDLKVASFYDKAFTRGYEESYSQSYNLNYADSFERGKSESYPSAYQSGYDQGFAAANEEFFQSGQRNPNRSSKEYKDAFKLADGLAYDKQYEKIRSASYDENKKKTYDRLIQGEISKNKAIRVRSARKTYQDHAVIKVESINTVDAGINGVGQFDQISQPGEGQSVEVVIANFGQKATKKLSIIVDGKSFNLPSIPAGSKVLAKGHAQYLVPSNAGIGSSVNTMISVAADIQASDSLVKRHFSSASLVKQQKLDYTIKYPVVLGALFLQTPVLIGESLNLGLDLSNISSKTLSDQLSIKMDTNHGSNLIVQALPQINRLQGTRTVSGAKLKVSDASKVLEDLVIDITLTQKGVVIGKMTSRPFVIKKVNAISKSKVILAIDSDSNTDRMRAKRVLAQKGLNAYDLYDVSLDRNAIALTNLNKQRFLMLSAVNSSKAAIFKKLENKKQNLFFFLNDGRDSFVSSVKSLPQFELAGAVKLGKHPHTVIGLGATETIHWNRLLAISINELDEMDKDLFAKLQLTDDELISLMIGGIGKKNVLAVNRKVRALTDPFMIKAFLDTYTLNAGTRKSSSYLIKVDHPNFILKKVQNFIRNGSKQQKVAFGLIFEPIKHNIFSDQAKAIIRYTSSGGDKMNALLNLKKSIKRVYRKDIKDRRYEKKIKSVWDQYLIF
jgi:hypothetical protein